MPYAVLPKEYVKRMKEIRATVDPNGILLLSSSRSLSLVQAIFGSYHDPPNWTLGSASSSFPSSNEADLAESDLKAPGAVSISAEQSTLNVMPGIPNVILDDKWELILDVEVDLDPLATLSSVLDEVPQISTAILGDGCVLG
ncbi:hypothetical protein BDV23DRAFT_178456 [Aspergillus alliaceus]|uniref:Uncharacterized protein n=1 Tax=Petromyces alliaceus TaxID=209559 RepID=A0A5N7CNP8_PETAA|nr:hypothetical protein BDV23DRAFT_178456 [Aspergillus alliaceus]